MAPSGAREAVLGLGGGRHATSASSRRVVTPGRSGCSAYLNSYPPVCFNPRLFSGLQHVVILLPLTARVLAASVANAYHVHSVVPHFLP